MQTWTSAVHRLSARRRVSSLVWTAGVHARMITSGLLAADAEASRRHYIIRCMNPLRIVSIGECTVDEYSDLKVERFGGISFNFAVHAKRCGADHVSLVSCAGEDHGKAIRSKLSTSGIDISRFKIVSGNTARQKILLTADGERIFPVGGYDPGVLTLMKISEDDATFIRNHNILISACFRQLQNIFDQAMRIPFDGWRAADFLDLSDFDRDPQILQKYCDHLAIAFVSGNHQLAEKLQKLSKETDCVVVVTLGSEGSFAFSRGHAIHQPALRVDDVVDSTGCGDAFQAAFTVSYWRDHDLQMALQQGATQAANVIQHLGAI